MILWFGKKKEKLNSEEYEKLLKKITEVSNDVNNFESIQRKQAIAIETIETRLDLLRGQFNRKLKGIQKEEQQIENSSGTLSEKSGMSELPAKDLNITPGIIPMKWP